MKLEGEQVLLRMHMSNFETWHLGPLYEALVGRARKEHLAGATVLGGTYGYVERGRLLGEHAGGLREEHPVVVEIVDTDEAVRAFLERAAPMLEGRPVRVTLERAHVVHYRGGGAEDAS